MHGSLFFDYIVCLHTYHFTYISYLHIFLNLRIDETSLYNLLFCHYSISLAPFVKFTLDTYEYTRYLNISLCLFSCSDINIVILKI